MSSLLNNKFLIFTNCWKLNIILNLGNETLVTKVAKNSSEAISNLQSTVRYLPSLDYVNSSKIASLGWCFCGGGQSLQLAINSEPDYPLAATVVYYGNLVFDKKEVAKIKCQYEEYWWPR